MSPQSHRILLVEDDENLIEMVRLAFQGEEGFHLEVARTGQEGVEKAEGGKPDLILMDVVMPGPSGYETARSLKNHPSTKHIPIFFLTAKSLEQDIQEGKKAGGDLYIVKPFSPFELMSVIQEYFQSHPTKG